MAFTKFELLTSPSFEKIRILSILLLTTQRDPRKFPAFTAVPVLAFPSSYLKVPIALLVSLIVQKSLEFFCKQTRIGIIPTRKADANIFLIALKQDYIDAQYVKLPLFYVAFFHFLCFTAQTKAKCSKT